MTNATTPTLSKDQTRRLRGLAHPLKPIIMVGNNGLSKNLFKEIEIALDHHELIKIRLRAERDTRQAFSDEILKRSGAQIVDRIGQIIVLFRRNPKKPKVIL